VNVDAEGSSLFACQLELEIEVDAFRRYNVILHCQKMSKAPIILFLILLYVYAQPSEEFQGVFHMRPTSTSL